VIGARTHLGPFSFVNRAASLGHDVTLGAFVSIGPGVTVAGGVTIGDGAMIGAGAIVLPDMRIGAGAIIGAGTLVRRHIAAGERVLGERAPSRVSPGERDRAAPPGSDRLGSP
jgi:acetyltransferase-like isoleucine patch superfamily enzyme